MLFLNNQLVNFENPAKEHKTIADDYHSKVGELRERFGKSITVLSRKKPKVNATGLLEPVSNATIPLHITVSGKNGREEWLYCENIPEIKDGVVIPETRQKIVRYGELLIDLEAEPDFAYFFLEKHEMIKREKYHILDDEAEERAKADKRMEETRLSNAIYDESSQLNIDVTFLRLIAKRWGIGNADNLSKAVLQNQLFDKVGEATKKKGGRTLEDFLKDIKSTDSNVLKVASTVRDAIDSNIVVFDNVDKRWLINYPDGSEKNLMSVSINDLSRKDEILILYLQSDNHLYSLLVSAMGKGEDKVQISIDKEAARNTDDMKVLRAYAKSLGINSFAKDKEAVRVEVLEALDKGKE